MKRLVLAVMLTSGLATGAGAQYASFNVTAWLSGSDLRSLAK